MPRTSRLILIVLLGLAVRLLFLWLEPATAPVADERTWTNWAVEGLLSERVGLSPLRTNMIFYPPLYPYFIALSYWPFSSLEAVKVAQILLSLLLIPAVGRLAATLFGERASLAAALVVALYPELIWFSVHFWSETLFMVFLWWGWERVIHADRTGHARSAAAAGLLFGFAILTRETVLFFIPLLAAWMAWRAPRRGGFKRGAVLLFVTLLTVAPWTYRNYLRFGAFVPVSTAGGLNLYQGNARLTRQEVYDRYEAVQGRIEQYRFGLRMGMESILERQPMWAFEKVAEQMPNFWEADSLALIHIRRGAYGPVGRGAAIATAVVVLAPYIAILGLFVLGLARAPIGRYEAALLAFLFFYMLLHVATHGFARYRLPVMPVLFLFAAAALRGPRAAADGRRRAVTAAVAMILVTCLAPSFKKQLWNPSYGFVEAVAPTEEPGDP